MKSLVLTSLSLLLLSYVLPVITYDSWISLGIGAVVLTLLNATLRPVLQLMFLPMNVITLGIFGWLINGAVLGFADYLIPNLTIRAFTPFGMNIGWLLSLIVISLMLTLLEKVIDIVI